MEIEEILDKYLIVGIISNYKSSFKLMGKVKDLDIKNIQNALKMVGLDTNILDKNLSDLTLSEQWKVELASKLNDKIIVVGNLSNVLNKKDLKYIKQLLLKLCNNYNKKIIVIDNNVETFFELVKYICVVQNHQIIYQSLDFYDDNIYNYTKMPKIIEFIKYVNSQNKKIQETTDIYELIKAIYRSVS